MIHGRRNKKPWRVWLPAALATMTVSCSREPTAPPDTAPVAVFTITPVRGTRDTVFTLDASGSFDGQNDLDELRFRWDVSSDGKWETEWVNTPVRKQTFGPAGAHKVTLQVQDSHLQIAQASQSVFIIGFPIADIAMTPIDGTIDTTFRFSAWASNDGLHLADQMQFRWDLDGDGVWEEAWGQVRNMTRQFAAADTYLAVLEVRNPLGEVGRTTREVPVRKRNKPPIAVVTLSSAEATVEDYVYFYTTSCTDDEDDFSTLQFRLDWQGDGNWDTSWVHQESFRRRYGARGVYYPRLVVRDPWGLQDTTSTTLTIIDAAPHAAISVSQRVVATGDSVTFSATACTDPDDAVADLEVRWDFEGDGTWDTDWSFSKATRHAYPATGICFPALEIRDPEGLSAVASDEIHVVPPPQWSVYLGGNLSIPLALSPDGSTIYSASGGGVLTALDTAGNVLWSFDAGASVRGAPAVDDEGTVFLGDTAGKLRAINPDGSVKWTHDIGSTIWTAPAISWTDAVYVGSSDWNLYAIARSTGARLWEYASMGTVTCAPVVARDSTIYFGSMSSGICALNPDGSFKWRHAINDGFGPSPAVAADGSVIVNRDNGDLYAIRSDRSFKWIVPGVGGGGATPVIGADGTVYSAGWDLHAIDENGNLLWMLDLRPGTPTVAADGTLLVPHNPWLGSDPPMPLLQQYDAGGGFLTEWLSRDGTIRSPVITPGGLICFGTENGYLIAHLSSTGGLATGQWPRERGDNQNTGRAK
ncbi:PQQ-binding-like beta-propeller repeat protein [Gemmatimonadota bacterium]